jgi:EAL domain-containing protein (putative c-di-GMP-specific phosphodiesterase class I)/GGDEF domain-containing protein
MFRRLRVKLTVLYTGLFCLVLFLIGATAYIAISGNTERLAREQLASTAAVFGRMSDLRLARLHDNADQVARLATFEQAVDERNQVAIRALLNDLRTRSDADLAFLVTREGLIVGGDAASNRSVSPGLQIALERDHAPSGVLSVENDLFQAATAPIPGDRGWIVLGAHIENEQLESLEALSSTPLDASVLMKRDGWIRLGADRGHPLGTYIDDALARREPRAERTPDNSAIAFVQAMPSLDGARSVLLLQYPLSSALSPYGALFSTLILISAVGIAILIAGTWFLARGITQPLLTLEEAARGLQQGLYNTVVVPTQDELSRLAESFNAMIDAIRERERKITQLAYHDTETRLPNRLALERRFAAAQHPQRLYLAAIGVDRFSHIRGAIGYALAGSMLRTLGGRLARLVPNAPMGQLSNDTLGVAFLAEDETDAYKRARVLVNNLEQPLMLDDQELDVTVTIGIAQPRGKGEGPGEIVERASVALDQARSAMQKLAMFDKGAYGDPARNLSLMGEMRRALETGDIFLAHQPKYNYRTGRIESAESLVRWKHPVRGIISPEIFVPMAEETGHIRALTDWLLQSAVQDQKQLARAGWPLTLSVNISARLLSDADFARHALEVVKQAPHQFCFEITETAVIDNPKLALEHVELFAQNGIRIAIDDYGSGLSSLAYLKQLPAHELKIDKMFVETLTANRRDALLVRSTIDLAHGLGLEVTAEGVETPAAFALLAAMRCDLAQGFLVSRPATVEELIAILNDERRLRYYQQTAASGAAGPQQVEPAPKSA